MLSVHIVELYAELDQIKSEALGYFDPRPWHVDRPQRPKAWKREDGGAMVWACRRRPTICAAARRRGIDGGPGRIRGWGMQ
jgi:hypothetical protein